MIPLLFALPIGGALVLLGAGGSILTVPLLVYGLGLDVRQAAGTSLLVVGVVALAGALSHRRAVCARVGTAFGLAGVLGAIPGAWLNHHVPAPVVLAGFGATVLVVALRMTRPLPAPRAEHHAVAALGAGFAGGVATGFFGVGGGFLIVPALTVLLGLDMRAAVATSLLVIALNSLGALAAHAAYGTVVWSIGAEVAIAALLGAALAWPLGTRISQRTLQRGFVVCLIFLGAGILAQGIGGILG